MDALFYLAMLVGSGFANTQSGQGAPRPPSTHPSNDGILEGLWNTYDQELAVIGLVYLMATVVLLTYAILTWRRDDPPQKRIENVRTKE